MILIVLFIIIAGIFVINDNNEKFGLFKALKSLFMLLIVLGCIALTFTGIGSIIGIPILWAISRIAFKNM